jgi:hypothetical protein
VQLIQLHQVDSVAVEQQLIQDGVLAVAEVATQVVVVETSTLSLLLVLAVAVALIMLVQTKTIQ